MLCVALTTACTWLGSFVVARVAPYMMTGIGYGTFFLFGSILIVIGIWALFFVPETKGELSNLYAQFHSLMALAGIPLEAMDGLFSVPTYKTCWASMTGKKLEIPMSGYIDDSILAEKGQAEVIEVEKAGL